MKTSLRLLVGLSRVAACIVVAGSAGGCVAAKHYDEARSVAETEMAGHARTRARLENALARLDRLEQDVAAKEAALSRTKQELDAGASLAAASKLEATVAVTEKRAAGELVEQLRSELARTGDHLRAFAGEKRTVEQALLQAEERLRAVDAASRDVSELVSVARDVAVGLGTKLSAGEVSLGVRDGALVLSVPADGLFVPEQSALAPSTDDLFGALVSTAVAHPRYRVELRGPSDTLGELRTRTLMDALIEKGIAADRIVTHAGPDQAKAVTATEPVPQSGEAAALPKVDDGGAGAADPSIPAAPAPASSLPYEIFLRKP